MRASVRDKKILIERKQVTRDEDYNTEVIVWVRHARLWANVQDVLPSKDENNDNGIRIGKRRVRIRINFRSDVTGDMRVVIEKPTRSVLQIVGGPAELGRKEGMEIMCEEYSTDGQGA